MELNARSDREFYDAMFRDTEYASVGYAEAVRPALEQLVVRFALDDALLLDVGSGRAWFQDLVSNWIGLDISPQAVQHAGKLLICGAAEAMPLKDKSVDAIWSITFLEHSPDPERAIAEMDRVLADNGVLYLAPAWRVPPWRPRGYEVRSYQELNWTGKVVKSILPALNLGWTRGILWVPWRLMRELSWMVRRRPTGLRFTEFEPNLDEFLLPDSDARNSLDSHEVLVWFLSRGFVQPTSTNRLQRILMRCGPVIVLKSASARSCPT
jgi:SAM-dependent methyltransferase